MILMYLIAVLGAYTPAMCGALGGDYLTDGEKYTLLDHFRRNSADDLPTQPESIDWLLIEVGEELMERALKRYQKIPGKFFYMQFLSSDPLIDIQRTDLLMLTLKDGEQENLSLMCLP